MLEKMKKAAAKKQTKTEPEAESAGHFKDIHQSDILRIAEELQGYVDRLMKSAKEMTDANVETVNVKGMGGVDEYAKRMLSFVGNLRAVCDQFTMQISEKRKQYKKKHVE